MIKRYETKYLVTFLLIAFLLPALMLYLETIVSGSVPILILYGIEAAAPTIAAFVVISASGELKDFFSYYFKRERIGLTIILPIGIVAVCMLLAKSVGCLVCHIPFTFGQITPTRLIIILWAFVAEEFGWRGYLLPALKRRFKDHIWAPVTVGLIWAVWHYHYFLITGIEVPLIAFFAGCVVESIIYADLLQYTRNNLLSCMIFHLSWNFGVYYLALKPSLNGGYTIPYSLIVVFEIIVAYILMQFNHKKGYF